MELQGGPCNVKNADLNRMYEQQKEFDENNAKAKKCKKVLDYLLTAFPTKTPELERFNVVSLYGMISHIFVLHLQTAWRAVRNTRFGERRAHCGSGL